ncbi:MAG: Glycosyltransferase [Parcubacteria group bacterium GW2011_GWA1_47_8]|nr:MAG: Glycosyltransferase [Parcubacteria group bacterium GW2011_GWA1_47_8]
MKILIATGIYPPQIGGPATYSKLLADKLPEQGHVVKVVNFGSVLHLPFVARHTAYFFKVVRAAWGVDCVYAQDPVSVGLPAMLAAKLLRKKFFLKVVGDYAWEQGVQRFGITDMIDDFSKVHEEHEGYSFMVRLLKRIEWRVAMGARHIIVPSNYLKGIVVNWGIPDSKITVIHNGFDAPVIKGNKETLRAGLSMSGYTMLSVGRLVPWKGFVELIGMMPNILLRIPAARLIIAGDGPDRDALAKKIASLHLEQAVTLVGKLPQEKLFEYIRASDVFVLNTAYEGFAHQLLEVMALGTPIVTTNVGGNEEMLEDGKNGLLVTHNEFEDFVQAIAKLHDDKVLAETLTKNAKDRLTAFSNERMLAETAQVLAGK